MAKRTNSPFRYDMVGSFLRTPELKQARALFGAGESTQEELKKVEDAEIRKLVARQKAAGLRAVTDGEFRRSYWHLDFFWGFDGIERVSMKQGYLFHDEETRADSARLCGKIRFASHPFVAHYKFLEKVAGKGVIAKQAIPAPAQLLAELYRAENAEAADKVYPVRNDLYRDIADAYRGIIRAFYDAGCRSIQLDDCTWGMLCDASFRAFYEQTGQGIDGVTETYLALNNAVLADLPKDLVVTTHVCRGNYHSTWAASGGYRPVADALFVREEVSAYFLEFDTDRAGDFSPLAKVPADKMVVLGLVSSKQGTLEDRGEIIRRVRAAEKYVPLTRLCLSPQCGFASTEEGNILTEEQQWAKIAFVKSVAEEIWGKEE